MLAEQCFSLGSAVNLEPHIRRAPPWPHYSLGFRCVRHLDAIRSPQLRERQNRGEEAAGGHGGDTGRVAAREIPDIPEERGAD